MKSHIKTAHKNNISVNPSEMRKDKTHDQLTYTCGQCEDTSNLDEHELTLHKQVHYSCDLCNFTKRHMKLNTISCDVSYEMKVINQIFKGGYCEFDNNEQIRIILLKL